MSRQVAQNARFDVTRWQQAVVLCIRSNLLEYLAGRSANRQMHIRDMITRTPANGDALHEKEIPGVGSCRRSHNIVVGYKENLPSKYKGTSLNLVGWQYVINFGITRSITPLGAFTASAG